MLLQVLTWKANVGGLLDAIELSLSLKINELFSRYKLVLWIRLLTHFHQTDQSGGPWLHILHLLENSKSLWKKLKQEMRNEQQEIIWEKITENRLKWTRNEWVIYLPETIGETGRLLSEPVIIRNTNKVCILQHSGNRWKCTVNVCKVVPFSMPKLMRKENIKHKIKMFEYKTLRKQINI